MLERVSLANKCLLLFGAAVVLIIAAALAVPFLRLTASAEEAERALSRQMVSVWSAALRGNTSTATVGNLPLNAELSIPGGRLRVYTFEQAVQEGRSEPFLAQAVNHFRASEGESELSRGEWSGWGRLYRFAQAVRGPEGRLEGLIALERVSPQSARTAIINLVFLLSAALVALGLAVMVFYLIINYLILSPVRSLRETAEGVRQGNLATRSEIQTGDEFEELAETFNEMLQSLQDGQRNLRSINAALETRVGALEAEKLALSEASRLKSQFLANVSHELRTPMNSVLGFADLLLEAAEREQVAGDESIALAKRKRYLVNIVSAGRNLLDLINGLLEMAKIEAGKTELNAEAVPLEDFAEAMLALMRPVADRKGVLLRLESVKPGLTLQTDRSKLQQIVFNLLSNAVKFSAPPEGAGPAPLPEPGAPGGDQPSLDAAPRPPQVTLRVEPLLVRAPGGGEASEYVRISVIDTGPGIAPEHLDLVFEKFIQLDRGYGRRYPGTGLGLSITKELTHLLQGEIQVQSQPGQGSMFSVILPTALDPDRAAQAQLEAKFRGELRDQPSRA
jgi:two-component system sensor histidine kinase BarA